MKRSSALGYVLAVLTICACSTDPLFGKVEGVGATLTAANKKTPFYGATVTIADMKARGYVDTTTTNAAGAFSFPSAPDATYRITATSANGKLSAFYMAEVIDEASPDGVTIPMAPAQVNSFVEFPGCYDRMGTLMHKLEYACTTADAINIAVNPNPLEGADIAFLNSGCDTSRANDASTVAHLRTFVSGGGRLLVSDRAWPFVAAAWPDKISWSAIPTTGSGDQRINARVTDTDLKRAMAAGRWTIEYDQPSWALPTSAGGVVFLRGDVRTSAGTRSDAPLLMGFPYGDGYVVYATFGWERQFTRDPLALRVFQYLIANK